MIKSSNRIKFFEKLMDIFSILGSVNNHNIYSNDQILDCLDECITHDWDAKKILIRHAEQQQSHDTRFPPQLIQEMIEKRAEISRWLLSLAIQENQPDLIAESNLIRHRIESTFILGSSQMERVNEVRVNLEFEVSAHNGFRKRQIKFQLTADQCRQVYNEISAKLFKQSSSNN